MSWSQSAFAAVAGLVGVRTGLAFPPSRRPGAELAIRRAMARAGVADPAGYAVRLAADAGALDDLIAELTVGETYFFREPAQFDFVRRQVLPDVRRRRGEAHAPRAWSAGCASGEEPYSLAILFAEEGLTGAPVLATDISRAALAKAREAVYGDWSLRGERAAVVRPYLLPSGRGYRLDERIRRRVVFAELNLALDTYPSHITGTADRDLILCRNVLIYLDPEAVAHIARRLGACLAEGGWLITASSDPPLADLAPFETVVADEGVFYRRKGNLRCSFFDLRLPDQETAVVNLPAVSPIEIRKPKTEDRKSKGEPAAPNLRALANIDPSEAERACAEATARQPLDAELGYLHGVLLLELGREEEAVRALRRVVYLDRTLAVAHFTLGAALRRRGDRAGARRAYRNARDLCRADPPDRPLPLADGETAGWLAAAAEGQLAFLESLSG
jgi:chemotaxis protein methyltransferase CheR